MGKFLKVITGVTCGLAMVATAMGSAHAFDLSSVDQLTSLSSSSPVATNAAGDASDSDHKLLGVGTDGNVRTVTTEDNGAGGENTLSNQLLLVEGDRVEVSEDGKPATIVQADGKELGSFISPTVTVDGVEHQGKFEFKDGNLLTTFADDVVLPYNCWQANTAKWTWRVASGAICTASGFANVAVGFACALGAAGAEDAMDINRRACR